MARTSELSKGGEKRRHEQTIAPFLWKGWYHQPYSTLETASDASKMVLDDSKVHAFEVSFADLQNYAASFQTFKLIIEGIGANCA